MRRQCIRGLHWNESASGGCVDKADDSPVSSNCWCSPTADPRISDGFVPSVIKYVVLMPLILFVLYQISMLTIFLMS
jgi:hypothetical protein